MASWDIGRYMQQVKDGDGVITGYYLPVGLQAGAIANVPTEPTTVALTTACNTCATSGDNTIVAAPTAGNRLVIARLQIQNESATTTTVLVKLGTTTVWRAVLGEREALSLVFQRGYELRGADAKALVFNLSGANSHGYAVQYFTEASS